jgi:hypothetical protein
VGGAHGVEGGLGGERGKIDESGQVGEGSRLGQPWPVAVERVENLDGLSHPHLPTEPNC